MESCIYHEQRHCSPVAIPHENNATATKTDQSYEKPQNMIPPPIPRPPGMSPLMMIIEHPQPTNLHIMEEDFTIGT